jgi:hypothetical protein
VDFELNDDQKLLMTSFEGLLDRFRQIPHGQHGYVNYGADLDREIREGGYIEIVEQPGFGVLEGALMVEAAASCPFSTELAASVLVGPLLGGVTGPLAVAHGVGRQIRYLEQADTVCVIEGGDVLVGSVGSARIRPITSAVAYPLAVLEVLPTDARRLDAADAAAVRRRVMIGIAAEAAGLLRGALELTVQYVKDREQFGKPIGDFQAVQHRLAEDAQIVRACFLLAMRAADADDAFQASVATLYAQDAMRKVITDCHQFSGAMGLTLEFPLHLWTYRLKYLQGEAGGKGARARDVAQNLWSDAA